MAVLHVVDSFTDRPFAGNPAAVMVVDRFPPDAWMQALAREMNLSETAFVVPRPDGDYDLRWMTPTMEVDLCGHATLASAHIVGPARFHTRSGALTCTRTPDGLTEMDFPADPLDEVDVPDFLAAQGVKWTGRGRLYHLAELCAAAAVREYQPDVGSIADLPSRGLIVTAPGDGDYDFVSRFFGPQVGIVEDPVTGSAHCALAGHWGERLGRDEMTAYQASARGGTVHVRRAGDRVVLGGRAVTVSEVHLLVPVG